jgi:hypothetical protein
MSHPHEYLLQEFQIAIHKLVPLTPPAVKLEAQQLHDELAATETSSEKQIHDALVHVGRKEYPYRLAYHELCADDEEVRLQKLVFDRLEPEVKTKIDAVTQHGVHILDYVKSPLFEEQLTSTERYQVEQAVLLAHDALNSQCSERAVKRQQNFNDLVAKWQAEEDRLQKLIDVLKNMVDRNPKWTDEIIGKVAELEEGWSVTERDPTEEQIKQEIDYFQTVLAEDAEDGEQAADSELVEG